MSRLLNSSSTSFTGVDLTASLDVELLSYTVTKDVLIDIRADIGATSAPLNSAASVITLSAWITRTNGEEVEAFSEDITKTLGQTQLPYNFYKKLLVLEGEVITITGYSTNALDISISGSVYIFGRNASYSSSAFTQSDLTSLIELGSYDAEHDYEVYVRLDLGTSSYVLDTGSTTLTLNAELTNASGAEAITYEATILKSVGITRLIYQLDDFVKLREDESLALNVSSNNVADTEISGTIYFALLSSTTKSATLDWIKNEFLPLQVITPDEAIYQQIDNAIRYWNTHSGRKISTIVDANTGEYRTRLAAEFKSVVQVWPTHTTEWILNDHPMWSLLGITILDNVTTDLIIMSEAFKNYRKYVGTDFQWHFERSTDPAIGGYLYYDNMPSQNSSLFVVGTKRILDGEDIEDDYILDWMQYYALALMRMLEGNTQRKAGIIGVNNDGDLQLKQGIDEKKELQEKLSKDSRWVALAKRF